MAYKKSFWSIFFRQNKKNRARDVQYPGASYKYLLGPEEKNENYRRKYLLTKNELYFYKEIKRIADKLNLTVLSKIRMADLVEPKGHGKKYLSDFGKIKAKHVDFALCDPENLYVLLLIEVDDRSHDTPNSIKRDSFVESVYKATGYTLYRARGTANLERDITEIINGKK